MIKTFTATIEPKPYDFINDVTYLDNSCGDSMCKKYNRAIDIVEKEGYEGWVCFIHDDAYIRTPKDVVEARLRQAYDKGQRIAGVMGTLNLDTSMHWWWPDRQVNGAGFIQQIVLGPDKKPVVPEKVYEMNDWPGYHDGLATVDGCCMWVHTDVFKKQRWDDTIVGYHFYDVDFCLQGLRNGFGVCVIPVVVAHASPGELPKNIDELRKPIFEKWARLVNTFPINKFALFRSDEDADEIFGIQEPATDDKREEVSDSAQGQLQECVS